MGEGLQSLPEGLHFRRKGHQSSARGSSLFQREGHQSSARALPERSWLEGLHSAPPPSTTVPSLTIPNGLEPSGKPHAAGVRGQLSEVPLHW